MPAFAPNLDDPKLFERRAGVPILDVHKRNGRVVDAARLRLVAENSNRRAAAGELGLLLIGHTTDDGPETDQPPLVGYVRNYRMGTWSGRDCILADLFYAKDKAAQASEYPRRSVEVLYSDHDPADNYIDAVALIKRRPERPLGLLSYRHRGVQLERYAMSDSGASAVVTVDELPALGQFMRSKGLTDVAEALPAFATWRADDANQFTADDITRLQKYAAANGLKLGQPGQYEVVLERYKADKRAGKLTRT